MLARAIINHEQKEVFFLTPINIVNAISPHKFTPMPGVHKSLKVTMLSILVLQ